MRKIRVIAVSFALMLVIASCSVQTRDTGDSGAARPPVRSGTTVVPSGEAGEAGPKVVVLQVGDEYDEQSSEVTSQTNTFSPQTPVMHISAGISGLVTGQMVQCTLRAVDVTDAEGTIIRDVEVVSVETEAPAEESTMHFEFSAPEAGWPVGAYAAEIAVADEVIEAIDITVE